MERIEQNRKKASITIIKKGKEVKSRVLCEPVVIKGFESYDFIVHQSVVFPYRYIVSHAQTGRTISTDAYESHETKEKAIKAATKLLRQKGEEGLQKAISKYSKPIT